MSQSQPNSFGNAVFMSFLGRYLSMILQLGSTVILARLIAPEDYGLFSIAIIFMATASIIKEFGVNNYLIKEKNLTPEIISSAYGILISFAFVTAFVLFISASYIADFYQQSELVNILHLLCLNVMLSPFGTIIACLLKRDLNFKPDVITGVGGQIIGITSMILMAFNDFGVYALVYGSLIQTLCQTIIIQFFRPPNMPLLPSFKKSKEILKYSKFAGIYGLTNHFGNSVVELFSGKFYSIEMTGQINRASSTSALFSKLFNEALNPVIMPHISKLNRTGGEVVSNVRFLTKLNLSLAWPFFLILGFCAEPVVLFLFGEQWLISAYFLQIFCVAKAIGSSVQLLDPVMMGLGMAKFLMNTVLVSNVLRIIICILMIPYGIMAMVVGTSMVDPIIRIIMFTYALRTSKVFSLREYIGWLKEPAILTIACSLPLLLPKLIIGQTWWQHFELSIPVSLLSAVIWIIVMIKQKNAELIITMISQRLKKVK
jgi:O-antigen/teichoic acid export membrane protein